MRPYDKPRDVASGALIELRAALGMSQAEFAIRVLDLSPMTVSRWETTTPPRGEYLLRLAELAKAKVAGRGLYERFLQIFVDDLVERVGTEDVRLALKRAGGKTQWRDAS